MQFTKALQHNIVWKAFNTLHTFLINLLIVRLLGAEYSGTFFYTIAALSFFTLVLSWSLEAGIIYYSSSNANSFKPVIRMIFPLMLLQGLLSLLLLALVPFSISKYLCWVFMVSNLAIIYFSALYHAAKKFVAVNCIAAIVNTLVLLLLGVMYYNTKGIIANSLLSPSNEFISNTTLVYFGGFVLQALLLILFFNTNKYSRQTLAATAKLPGEIFRYSTVAFVSNLLFFFATRIDYYFVEKYTTPMALSNYVQVSKMGQLLILLPTIMASVIFPFSSGKQDEGLLLKMQAICRIVSFLFLPVAFLGALAGYRLFPLLFGADFKDMYSAFLFYLPGFFALSLITLMAAYLAGKKILIANMQASAIALVTIIIGDILLIPILGINAAAGVSSIGYIFCMIFLLHVFQVRFHCVVKDFFILKKNDFKLLLAAAKA